MNYGRWIWRIVSWDTLLPMAIVLVPYAVDFVFPKNPDAMMVAAVAAPIVALILRAWVGQRQMAENNVSRLVLHIQHICFMIGLLPPLFGESVFILVHAGPGAAVQGPIAQLGDYAILAIVFWAPYLLMMTIAMYPGPEIDEREQGAVAE
jgi:hypothetical protein